MNNFMNSLEMDRKPFDQSDISSFLDMSAMDESTIEFLTGLQEIAMDNLPEGGFFSSFDFNGQYAIFNINDELFLVDNQGYDYARYVVKLINVNALASL